MKINSSKGILFAAVAALGLTFGITSCNKDLLNVNVPLEFAEITFTIPITPLSGPYADTTIVTTDIDSILSANKVKKENIKSIKLEKLTFTIMGEDSLNNFRLLESIKGAISKDGGSYATVGEVNGNPDVISYELNGNANTGTEFKDYLNGSTFSIKVSGNTRGPVTQEIVVHAKLKFKMEAGL